MALVNRDKDVSEQKDIYQFKSAAAIATGVTLAAFVVPYPCTLVSVGAAAYGVSNAMQVAIKAERWTTGGVTQIDLGASNLILQNFSTSGLLYHSGLQSASSTLMALQVGDVVRLVTSVASSNVLELALDFVFKKTQDIVATNGVTS